MIEAPELHRPVDTDSLKAKGKLIKIDPNGDELAAIAKRLDLIAVKSMSGEVRVTPAMGRQIVAEGTIRAEVVQTCVVTGEPLATTLEFPLSRRYAEDVQPFAGLDDEEEITDPNDDGPDPIENNEIDVGEAAVEELALQIPLYPRTPGANYSNLSDEDNEAEWRKNPFAALEALKNRLKSDN